MGLRAKFNLVLILMFLVGLGISGYVSYSLLQKNARAEIVRNAELMLATAKSIRNYTVSQIRPLLADQLTQTFHPQTVPAYAATEAIQDLRTKYPHYSYKEATLNPTNPRDLAEGWEIEVIDKFRKSDELTNIVGERYTADGRILYIANPIKISNPACLACHSEPSAAPASMLKLYGRINGFGWEYNEIVGAQIVSVPMTLPIQNANEAFLTFMISLFSIFLLVFVTLNLMLNRLIIAPIVKMSESADKVSVGDFSVPELHSEGKDEISLLSTSFNRMRRSLEKALKMIS